MYAITTTLCIAVDNGVAVRSGGPVIDCLLQNKPSEELSSGSNNIVQD
jgi:hypothetical protein